MLPLFQLTDIDLDATEVVVYGSLTVGALTSVLILTTWLRKLTGVSGRGAVRLTAGVATYVSATLYAAPFFPKVSLVLGFLLLAALLGTAADAFFTQNQTAGTVVEKHNMEEAERKAARKMKQYQRSQARLRKDQERDVSVQSK